MPRTIRPPDPSPPAATPPVTVPPGIDPSLICDAATTVPDPKKHKFVRVGQELIPIGFDAAGQQLASAGAPFGKPRV